MGADFNAFNIFQNVFGGGMGGMSGMGGIPGMSGFGSSFLAIWEKKVNLIYQLKKVQKKYYT